MSLKRFGIALLSFALVALATTPASAAPKETKSTTDLDKHAVEFVANNPTIYSDPSVLDAYTKDRMSLLGMKTEPSLATAPGEASILCGSFCYQIIAVHSISTQAKTVDELAFPIWEATVRADWGSGGATGTWTATWVEATESGWHVDAEASGEAGVAFLGKIKYTVGGGYERKTTTSWSGSTNIAFAIPEGKKQTLYSYEKGTYWTFSCDCTVAYSGGSSRTTVTSAASGREAYPYQATTFRKGAIVNI